MVAVSKTVRLLVKLPLPEPSLVLLFAVVGLCSVLQHMPRDVTGEPPFNEIFPPDIAVICVIPEIGTVDTVGIAVNVVKVRSFP